MAKKPDIDTTGLEAAKMIFARRKHGYNTFGGWLGFAFVKE